MESVEKVRDYVKSITGFKEVHYKFALQNKGLGNSVIKGVTEVINRYGKAIVLEDDLILAPNFLFFMNQGLDKYKEETSVFSICGYSNKVKVPKIIHMILISVLVVVHGDGLLGLTAGIVWIGSWRISINTTY